MKKILTSLAVIAGITTGAFAQKNIDLELTSVITPQPGEEVQALANGDSMVFAAIFTNLGPDAIAAEDTITFWISGEGVASDGTSNYYITNTFTGLTTAAGGSDTLGIVLEQGYVWGDAGNGPVTTNLPQSGNDTFFYIIDGYDKASELAYTDPGYDASQATMNDRLGDSSNNIIATFCTFVGGSTGIDDVAQQASIEVFPNPATEVATINFNLTSASNATIHVTDVTGRTVMTQELGKQAAGAGSYTLNLGAMSNGMYNVEFITENGRVINKLTVRK